MTGEQIIERVKAQRAAKGLRLTWIIPDETEPSGQREYVAYAKDEAQKTAWIKNAKPGWELIEG